MSPKSTGTLPDFRAAWTGRKSNFTILLFLDFTIPCGGIETAFTPFFTSAPVTRAESAQQARCVLAQATFCSAVLTPLSSFHFRTRGCPKEPAPWTIMRSLLPAFQTFATAEASEAIAFLFGLIHLLLFVIAEPPSFSICMMRT